LKLISYFNKTILASHKDIFGCLKNLSYLELDKCDIVHTKELYKNLHNLTTLKLKLNFYFEEDLFEGLKSLKELFLDMNEFKMKKKKLFPILRSLCNLEKLEIWMNDFVAKFLITDDNFNNLNNLKDLIVNNFNNSYWKETKLLINISPVTGKAVLISFYKLIRSIA
jgi:hypothetical protein